jgi:hypothetical protein
MYFVLTAIIDIDTDDGLVSHDRGAILTLGQMDKLRHAEENIFIECIACFSENVAIALAEDLHNNLYI